MMPFSWITSAILSPMPTPESAAVFTVLVEARAALTEITRRMNQVHAKVLGSRAERQEYAELQKRWDELYQTFRIATEEFMAVVDNIERPKE